MNLHRKIKVKTNFKFYIPNTELLVNIYLVPIFCDIWFNDFVTIITFAAVGPNNDCEHCD